MGQTCKKYVLRKEEEGLDAYIGNWSVKCKVGDAEMILS